MPDGLSEKEVALHHLDEAETVLRETRDDLSRAIRKIHLCKQALKGVEF